MALFKDQLSYILNPWGIFTKKAKVCKENYTPKFSRRKNSHTDAKNYRET